MMAKASNIAYQYLRSTASNDEYVKKTCSPATQPGSQALAANTGLNNASVNVVISCPYGSSSPLKSISLLTATVTYAGPGGTETVTHGMYAKEKSETAGSGGTGGDGTYMQTVTSANCPTTRTMKVDARDNRTYWVQKLADGKCWMLTNLAYAGGGVNTYGDTKALSNGTGNTSTTYTEAKYYISPGANPTTSPTPPSTSTTGTGQYGYHYNWCAAMGAQTSTGACSTTNMSPLPNAAISICPSGWRLPTSNIADGGELRALINAVGAGGLMSIWLMQLGGFLSWDGAYYSQGTGGMYWSSFTNNAAYAYILTGSSLGYDDESRGNTVRCIAN